MRYWLIQANPNTRWNIFEWWENRDGPLDNWLLSWAAPDLQPGDMFAIWVSGPEAGVYAVGEITRSAVEDTSPEIDPYWREPPGSGPVWRIGLDTQLYLFGAPIRKAELASDPAFSQARVLRMPRSRNPIPLQPSEWNALVSYLPTGTEHERATHRTSQTAGEPVVTLRRRGAITEDTTVRTGSGTGRRSFNESRLVAAYEKHLGRQLPVLTGVLPSGARLVTDAYDTEDDTIIEAKNSASRQNVRMAIGQLLDYRQYLKPSAKLAVLLPEEPSEDLVNLLASLEMDLIYQHDATFVRSPHAVQAAP